MAYRLGRNSDKGALYMYYNHNTLGKKDGKVTSGYNKSFWMDAAETVKLNPLRKNLTTEVVIVGGGIAGLTTAYCLAKAGWKIVLVEDGFLGSGETGRTTAHIVNALDDRYTYLEHLYGAENAKLIASSHTTAINFIDTTVKREHISCGFKRLSGYLFLHPSDERKTLEDELDATRRAGIDTLLLDEVPGMELEKGPALEFPDQAQFQPLEYITELCHAVIKYGGEIYTESRATKINEEGVTANGYKIKARHIVVATNTPVNNLFTIHTKQHPYRTYVIGALIPRGSAEPRLWWDTGNHHSKWVAEPYKYIRTAEYDERFDLLICGGEDHKTGQGDDEDITEDERYQRLAVWLKGRFPMAGEIVHKWSGQVMEPVDSIAFIGKNPGSDNIYIITGDSGNGITYGTLGGILVADLIEGRKNPWEKIYSPSRITLKTTGDFLKEMGNMTLQYADYLTRSKEATETLQPGDGAVINEGLKKIAVYKDTAGELHAFSAVCPHLGCVLQWNGDEKTFDCPCHGSRFTAMGKVVNGPAITDLKAVKLKK